MTTEEYKAIATSIWRSGFIHDKNRIRQEAREKMRHLIVMGLIGEFKHLDPQFNEKQFLGDCGF